MFYKIVDIKWCRYGDISIILRRVHVFNCQVHCSIYHCWFFWISNNFDLFCSNFGSRLANFNPFKVLNNLKLVNSHHPMSVIRFCSNKYRIRVGSSHLSGWRWINDNLRPIFQQFLIKIGQFPPYKSPLYPSTCV